MSVKLYQSKCLKKYYNTFLKTDRGVNFQQVNYTSLVNIFCSKSYRKYADSWHDKYKKKPLAEINFKFKF